jgi:protein-tyrosine-phosphatase
MVIHFVCRGNTHRSRLAEAYAKSRTQDLHDIVILSSGIEADRDLNGAIVPFVQVLLQEENLLDLTGPTWIQTTQPMIDRSDVIVFMNDDVSEDAKKQFDVPSASSQTWHIVDVEGVDGQIRLAVDGLVSELRNGVQDL